MNFGQIHASCLEDIKKDTDIKQAREKSKACLSKTKTDFIKNSKLDNIAWEKNNIKVIQKEAAAQVYASCLFEKLPHFNEEDEKDCKTSTKNKFSSVDIGISTDDDWEETIFSRINYLEERIHEFRDTKSPEFVCDISKNNEDEKKSS